MKRIICSLFMTVASLTLSAQAGDLFAQFRHAPKAEYTSVSRMMLALVKPLVRLADDDKELRLAMKAIRSIRVLDLEDCAPRVKSQFMEATAKLNTRGYTDLIRSNQDGERTLILYKMKRGVIRELLIVESSPDDAELIQLKGRIRPEDISNIINTTSGKHKKK